MPSQSSSGGKGRRQGTARAAGGRTRNAIPAASSGPPNATARRPGPAPSRIHAGLVGARALVGTPYLGDPALRAEYARDIAPRTVAALAKVLDEAFPADRTGTRPRRALDLGAGTGAVGEALRHHFGDGLRLLEVDQVPVGRGTRIADITDVPALAAAAGGAGGGRGVFDLVVAAHVLNELFIDRTDGADLAADRTPDPRAPTDRVIRLGRLVRRWCEALLAEGGTLILIEPALRETSRALLGVRDQLLAAGLHVVAPCFFAGPCPALGAERDWCHDSAPLESGRRADFSYLVVRADGEAATDPTRLRIVSDPLPDKGRLRLFACGITGRQPLIRLDRHATRANADLDRLRRGDVARVERTTFATDGIRVGTDTTIERKTPAADNTAGQTHAAGDVPAE